MPPSNPEQERRALVAAHVHRLVSTPEWDFFWRELERTEQTLLEACGTVKDDPRYTQGALHGVREIMKLPARLIAQGRT